ncbi:response regulator [Micavibrio aeruginosavorus]|uniref:Two-component response regulator n=1 Tax=Micavibrio aeruginosavorus EPB TaxID=349215 RepID=M4VHP6_9BACT|nr:response regulator [Micavibrio aeruginosavorus]AGH97990.1 two-component response regulator [Micavibrio aeruginosavorus EPB]
MGMTLQDLEDAASAPSATRSVLIVDDDRISLKFLDHQVQAMGYRTVLASDGHEALTILQHSPDAFGAILLDRIMPHIDGMTVMQKIKDNPRLRDIPVVMQTSAKSPEEIEEGIGSGVFHYLTKPINIDMLRVTLRSAMRTFETHSTNKQARTNSTAGFGMLQSAQFNVRTPEEAKVLAAFLSECFPEPERVLQGIEALLFNAIEHGNLEIGGPAKAELSQSGALRREIEQRLSDPRFASKAVEVTLTRKDGGVYVVVSDQGEGFNWRDHLKIDPVHAGNRFGRGIAMAGSVCFDKLMYNDKGNKAVAYVADGSALNW